MRPNRARDKGKKPIKQRPEGYTGKRRIKLKQRAKELKAKENKVWKRKSQTNRPFKSSVKEGKNLENIRKEILAKFQMEKKDLE